MQNALREYMGDEQVAGDAMRVDPRLWPTLSPPAALVLADALTRKGRLRQASRVYRQVLRQAGDQPAWADAARSGLGWIAMAQGDLEDVRQYLGDGGTEGSRGRGTVLLALLDAAEARPGAAAALERLGRDADVNPQLREVARLGVGYANFWAADYDAARRSFAVVRDGRFADDARYGAAWSSHVAGDEDTARAELQDQVVRGSRPTRRRISKRLIRLEPRAVLRAGLWRYGDVHAGTDEAWLAEMLDADGSQLARAALRMITREASTAVEPREVGTSAVGPAVRSPEPGGALAAGGGPRGRAASPASSYRPPAILLGLTLLGIAAAAALWRRRAPVSRR